MQPGEAKVSTQVENPAKKYMCVNPYEGFVCKREGNLCRCSVTQF